VRVLHVIVGLGLGGAEQMLARLVEASAGEGDAHEVVSLTTAGPVAERLQALGIRVHAVGMSRATAPLRLARLARTVRASRPDVVQTWMYHADLLGGLAARLGTRARVVWGIHHSALDRGTSRATTRMVARACARLSRTVPDRIVCVSQASRDQHAAAGYAADRMVVIPNGFDLERFRPDPAARRAVRAELGIGEREVVIGLVARVEPPKDHPGFLEAAGRLARRAPEVRFLLCGGGTERGGPLVGPLQAAGIAARTSLLGQRTDVARVLAALDVACLASRTEAFPLVIGEAMACGVPCAVTDVGDCALLVGASGRVVPPRDPAALAAALEVLVRLGPEGRARLGEAARERIATRFSIERVAAAYGELYRALAGAPAAAARASGTG
jgi:glycosyltransferase involved in cell wall biosynthesis